VTLNDAPTGGACFALELPLDPPPSRPATVSGEVPASPLTAAKAVRQS
jgi:hypothetical protein